MRLSLANFIFHVPAKPPTPGRSHDKRVVFWGACNGGHLRQYQNSMPNGILVRDMASSISKRTCFISAGGGNQNLP